MKLDDFLKCKKVRAIRDYGESITEGKEYEIKSIDYISVSDNDGDSVCVDTDWFEPVIDKVENPLQNIELTPEFEAVEPKFKTGDKVYIGLTGKIRKIDSFNSNDGSFTYSHNDITTYSKNKDVVKATQENYELLCKLYPHIEFERPPKPLMGSDLARAMFDNGHEYIVGRVGTNVGVYYAWDDSAQCFFEVNGYCPTKIEPIDPRTGEPLTESVLDE